MDIISMPIPTTPRTALCDTAACARARTAPPAAENTCVVCFIPFAASLAAAAYLRFSFRFWSHFAKAFFSSSGFSERNF